MCFPAPCLALPLGKAGEKDSWNLFRRGAPPNRGPIEDGPEQPARAGPSGPPMPRTGARHPGHARRPRLLLFLANVEEENDQADQYRDQ